MNFTLTVNRRKWPFQTFEIQGSLKVVRALEPSSASPLVLKSIKVITKFFHFSGLRENLNNSYFPVSMVLALIPPPPPPTSPPCLPPIKLLKNGTDLLKSVLQIVGQNSAKSWSGTQYTPPPPPQYCRVRDVSAMRSWQEEGFFTYCNSCKIVSQLWET